MIRRAILCFVGIVLFCDLPALAQNIQPIITEYIEKADGKFELTNNTLTPMAIVLEPKSFSVSVDGRGVYRPLDPGVHLELSAMSFRLEPKQTYYVFYKARAEKLPVWFTVYAVFSPIQKDQGLKVRIMLPHTVYLYQKKPLNQEAIHIGQAEYVANRDIVSCDLENLSPALVRVQEVRAVSGKTSVVASGFPLLPQSPRHLEFAWNEKTHPEFLILHFPHFDLKEPLKFKDQ